MNIDLHHLIADKARIEKILDFLPYPFLMSEQRDGTYHNLYFNKKFVEEIGYTLADMPTIDDWFMIAYPDETYRNEVISGWKERTKTALDRGEDSILMKVIIRTKVDGYQWFEVKSTTSKQFQMVAFVSIGDTIIREKALELLVENKNRTLSILAHDLRAPVTNLHSLTELVLHDDMTREEFMNKINHLHQRSGQLLDFIDTTLLWTKANFDTIEVKSETVQLPDSVKKILMIYEHTYTTKSLNISISFEKPSIISDGEIVKILLRNMISNAIKFTPDNGTISICDSHNNGSHRISVSDTGVGMTRETLNKIFSMDNYRSSLGTRQEKGLGIGLKLCQHLVKRINGRLEIDSEPGKGTVVSVVL
jgi:signal transduction histidine kinase